MYIVKFFFKFFKVIFRYILYCIRKRIYKRISISTIICSRTHLTPKYIECGNNVYIGTGSMILGIKKYNEINFSPSIIFEDNVSIMRNLYLTCANNIVIGKNTAIASNVTITDIHHPYTDPLIPIEQQNLEIGKVHIGEDCKIYNNVVILPNTTIGKHVTIGANSVVNRNIPDYSIAVGIPAKIIKRYDFHTKSWRKTNSIGDFLNQDSL